MKRIAAFLALVTTAVGAVVVAAVPAVASIAGPTTNITTFCPESNPGFTSCYISYQTYPSGTTGLRASMDGSFSGYVVGATDKLFGSGTVWDLNEDGYRARVWLDIFYDCWCVDNAYRVPGPQLPDGTNDLGTTRVFDSKTSSGTPYTWEWINHAGYSGTYYTVRVVVGRYRKDTRAFQQAEEQRFYLTMGGN